MKHKKKVEGKWVVHENGDAYLYDLERFVPIARMKIVHIKKRDIEVNIIPTNMFSDEGFFL